MPLTDEWEKFVAEYVILPPSDGGNHSSFIFLCLEIA